MKTTLLEGCLSIQAETDFERAWLRENRGPEKKDGEMYVINDHRNGKFAWTLFPSYKAYLDTCKPTEE